MAHINTELWNIHQLCVLQVLNAKEATPARKEEGHWLRQKCRDIISREPTDTMS